jgi:hypothetical protein
VLDYWALLAVIIIVLLGRHLGDALDEPRGQNPNVFGPSRAKSTDAVIDEQRSRNVGTTTELALWNVAEDSLGEFTLRNIEPSMNPLIVQTVVVNSRHEHLDALAGSLYGWCGVRVGDDWRSRACSAGAPPNRAMTTAVRPGVHLPGAKARAQSFLGLLRPEASFDGGAM